MIAELGSYRIADFIPFSSKVYGALLRDYNSSLWPGQWVWLAGSVLAVIWIWRRPKGFRVVGIFLAAAWIWTGVDFFLGHLTQLMDQARYGGWIFIAQGMLCLGLASGVFKVSIAPGWSIRFILGGALYLAAGFIPWGLLFGLSHGQLLLFGWGPEATALGTLGVLLMTQGSAWRWLLVIIPGLWGILAALLYYGLATQ